MTFQSESEKLEKLSERLDRLQDDVQSILKAITAAAKREEKTAETVKVDKATSAN